MIPKEKAEELVENYYQYLIANKNIDGASPSFKSVAKQCAFIAQNNLLNKLDSLGIVDQFEKDVLIEINAL